MFSNLGNLFGRPFEAPLAVLMGCALIATVIVGHYRPKKFPQSYVLPGSTAGTVLIFIGLDLSRAAHAVPRFTADDNGELTATWAYPQPLSAMAAVVITACFVALAVGGIRKMHLMTAASALVGTFAMLVITSCILQYTLRDDPGSSSWFHQANVDSWFLLILSLPTYAVTSLLSLVFWTRDRQHDALISQD